MKTRARRFRRSIVLIAVAILAVVLTACTGRGGGYLPTQSPAFTGQAPFGFTFSCQDQGGINPPTGQLKIELAYGDLGTSLALGAPFSIHGIVDTIDPVLESAICQGQNPPPPPENQLIFLGRYYRTTSAPPGFPATCPTRETKTTPLCRFEVIVQDNDQNLAPSPGDFFSIKLSSATCTDPSNLSCSQLPVGSVFYARAGYLAGGNIIVK
jgi:hypothetical protein